MNELLIGKNRPNKFNKVPLSLSVRKTINALLITLTLMITTLAVLFLSMTSNTAQKGYKLQELQRQHIILQNENEKLKNKLTESLSFQKIENTEQVGTMIEPEGKTFITNKARN